MPYQATVYNVMIASPSDVEQERRIAREVIYEWNSLHSATSKIVLEPVGWETHSSPEMGDRPQAIINKQILTNTDLLIGIFWTRLGTPTGKAESGTVEEIQEHIKAKKPAMIYFSKQPVILESVDQDQYQKLKVFIDECRSQGLLSEYDSLSHFKEILYRHLVLKIKDNEYFNSGNSNYELLPANLREQIDNEINLSDEAKELLVEASKSPDGRIMKLYTRSGLLIQTNGKGFASERDARLEAIWVDALKQLLDNDFIEEKGHKGEIFAVTRSGYEYADKLSGNI